MSPSHFAELARNATARVPCIGASWRVDDLALVLDHEPDREAWVQLGVTLEAIAVTAAANGVAMVVESLAATPVRLAIQPCTIVLGMHRLAACLTRQNRPFHSAPVRLAAHVQARLSGAAATHGCALTWNEVSTDTDRVRLALPDGVCAMAIVHATDDDRASLVRGGRASCRVWLEATSLGLAVLPTSSRPPAISITWLGMAA